MKLKQYQLETLATLRRFLEESRIVGPAMAYESVVQEPEQASRLGHYADAYQPLNDLPQVPYVCLRLPTGGGKTLLAARAVDVARHAWVEKDWPLVLWLVPTNTIRRQTVEALKNPRHSYRKALDENFDSRVRVFDIGDFQHVRPHDIRNNCCLVVGTIQTLRVTNTEGRKVYAHHEDLEPHFSARSSFPDNLERLDDGSPKFSFANLLHIHQPLMIVDEAHNAVTGLTREMQSRVSPCAIIEFTATPRRKSNILHSVTAGELKKEEMIKLPVMLSEHDTWQNAVGAAVAARKSLAKEAASDQSHIRPIVLFQAQPKNLEVTIDVLKEHLIEAERIPAERIAVATGDQRELDGIDLFDPACPIEHVITVEALKEGWDCSFAYVFCSVARIRDAKDVEQLLGRVLRMPYAEQRASDRLNRAYAFLSEPTFGEAAKTLVDKLVKMGFDDFEARQSIVERTSAEPELDLEDTLLDAAGRSKPLFTQIVEASPSVLSNLRKLEGVSVRQTEEERVEISFEGAVDDGLRRAVLDAVADSERKRLDTAIEGFHRTLSPAELGESFKVPRLRSAIQGSLGIADTDALMEHHDWSILDHTAELAENEFAIRETSREFEINLNGNRITYQFARESNQLALDVDVEGWTPEALVIWLDQQVREPDIRQSEMLRWLGDLVHHLTSKRGLHISALMRCKYILARKVREKIADIRQLERKRAYQRYLIAPDAEVEVSFDHAFEFNSDMYLGERHYRGPWKPTLHFLGPERVPAFDGAKDGEEFQCAQVVDSLPGVKHWIRNVARHQRSFWLPTATGRFYPDFLASMKDGRLLVVEYKGAHLADGPDTSEKRVIGEIWARKSEGKGVFLIAEKSKDGKDARAQILERLRGG